MSENVAIRERASEVPGASSEDRGERWRETLLSFVLRYTFYLGTIVYLPSMYMCYVGSHLDIAIMDTVAIGGVYALHRSRRWRFAFRTAGLIALLYALGAVLLVSLGPISQIYLFGFSLFAGLLLGTRAGLFCVALNGATLLVVGLTGAASPSMTAIWDHNPNSWFVIVANFLFMNALLVIANGFIIAALERALTSERQARERAEDVAVSLRESVEALKREVDERRRTEEALAVSVERFRLHSRATTDAIWDLDPATGTIWWSEGYTSLFGNPDPDSENDFGEWKNRVHPDDIQRVSESLQRALNGTVDQWQEEYRFRRANGTYAVVLDRGHISRGPSGVAVRMVGGIADLTERKLLEQHLLRTQRMESIGTLAGGIAHDLNNVLSPILMSTDRLLDRNLDKECRAMLDMIRTSAQRGAALVRQVLTFARGIEGVRKPIDLNEIVNELLDVVRDTFPKSIDFVVNISPDLAPVIGEPTQLQQVLMNLSVNARDAMPQGGKLTVSIKNLVLSERTFVHGVPLLPGPYVMVSVEDVGMGIPKEIQDRVFEPFFTTKEIGRGTGLGLSTSFSIVRGHGGAIAVHSALGTGTQFLIYLPAAPSKSIEARSKTRQLPPKGNGELVLVVDDEEAIRDVAGKTLQFFGYRVAHASNGAEALAIFKSLVKEIDIIVTDISMPVMDGPTMIRALRDIDPNLPIVASSGLTSSDTFFQATGPEIRLIPKPYTTQELMQAVHDVLVHRPVKTQDAMEQDFLSPA